MDLDELEFRMRRKEMISRFTNGEERYNTSALFRNSIESLLRMPEPYGLIDQLITIAENAQKELLDRIINNPPERIVIKDGVEYKLPKITIKHD